MGVHLKSEKVTRGHCGGVLTPNYGHFGTTCGHILFKVGHSWANWGRVCGSFTSLKLFRSTTLKTEHSVFFEYVQMNCRCLLQRFRPTDRCLYYQMRKLYGFIIFLFSISPPLFRNGANACEMYSASSVDAATTDCSLLFQAKAVPPIVATKPLVDFRDLASPPQSASKYARNSFSPL